MHDKQAGKTILAALAMIMAAFAMGVGGGALWAGQAGPAAPVILDGGAASPAMSNVLLKFGYLVKPKAASFGDAWLFSIAADFGLNRNMALGFEFQPAVRNYSDIGLTVFPMMSWLHLKVGESLGRLVPALKPIKLYVGAGAGGEFTLSTISFEGQMESEFEANLGYKIMFGALVKLGKARFNVEYQMARISDPDIDPDFWRHHIMVGFGF